MEEEEFWQNELQIEQESEQQLRQQLAELQSRVRDCEAKLSESLARIQVSFHPVPEGLLGVYLQTLLVEVKLLSF